MFKHKIYFLSILLLSMSMAGSAGAMSFPLNNSVTANSLNASFRSYLAFYFPNKTISLSSFYSYFTNSSSYVVMQLKAGNQSFVLINTSGRKYSLVTSSSQALSIFDSIFSKANFVNQTDISSLKHQMAMFNDESNASIGTCLYITGLTRFQCTLSNYCQSCSSVPACNSDMQAVGGPASPFGYGIMNFSRQYSQLNTTYRQYFSILSGINNSNFVNQLAALNSTLNNITSIAQKMPQNPVFPLNQTMFKLLNTCPVGALPLQMPWYCVDIGYCPSLTFNYSLISSSHQLISNELSSKQEVASIASSSAALAATYSEAAIQTYNKTQFSLLMNRATPLYSSILNKSSVLLSKANDTALSLSLANLTGIYSTIKSKSLYQNISIAGNSLLLAINRTQTLYSEADAMYNKIQNLSLNNTALILKDELGFKQIPYSLAYIGSEQQSINLMLAGKVNLSNSNSIVSSLNSISAGINAVKVPSYPALVSLKNFAEPFVMAVMSMDIPVFIKLQFAYLLVPILFLLIGIMAIIILYIIYAAMNVKAKRKERSGLWKYAFVACILAMLVAVYYSYGIAAQANSFLPISAFSEQMNKSSVVAIAAPQASSSCVSLLQGNITKAGKTPIVLQLNATCNLLYSSQCIDTYLSKGMPVIYINSSSGTFLSYKGLYGTILYANASATGPQCLASRLLFAQRAK
ncbi:hypothetical protein M1141_02665 [Candidatus Marsarchaeota archaeon]|nr:hypothetical protein [Candidatus Marsarchaeota archaeon]